MKFKFALLLLLVFASSITVTAIAFTMPTSISLPTFRSAAMRSQSLIKPLGDPVPGPGFPH